MTAQTITLYDFEEHLEAEWMIPPAVLWENRAEVFALYMASYTCREVAEYLMEKTGGDIL